jgi:uncharacterized membrane protein YqjE
MATLRAVDGHPTARVGLSRAEVVPTGRHGDGVLPPSEMGTGELVKQIGARAELLLHKQIELAKVELKHDLKAEAMAAGGLGVSAVLAVMSATLLLVAAAMGLAVVLPAWGATLIVAGATLLVTIAVAAVSWKKRVSKPLARTRQTLREDLRWAKERLS